ncbi:DNA primase small subunit [Psilocybe cubensis]|uniref:DNA primase small subunit n=1 Tax=Psilocybe cubensis TaxID=181762 RepID=A0ACB8HCN2_PSICU|nr:DNA primase small subunit [Psilocybe cubensis]KAH9485246.1 DNA primase small subunit [Psilocybe cubensis]
MSSSDSNKPSPEVMLAFYRRLYPFKSLFTWLNHDHVPSKLFTQREIAFSLPGDVYIRYNSFNTADELKKQVCQLNPTRFEIGPIYSARPRDRKTLRAGTLTPILRELVFDIDMTDYDPVRTCCSGADICKRCWVFISAAVRVMDSALREEFGYEKLLWVYSGRRGIHLWISDKEAMGLTDQQRKAVVGFLTVVQGGKESSKKLNIRNGGKLPPSLAKAMEYLKTVFGALILSDQECFQSKEGYEELLKAIPDSRVVDALRTKWEASPSRPSEDKWADLHRHNLMVALEDIIFNYTYPRLDIEVSKHRNHLLKAPFCIHPSTGRVCVPLDLDMIEKFDPKEVPTVQQLLEELDNLSKVQDPSAPREHHSDWEKTSLKPYIDILDRHAQSLVGETRKDNRSKPVSTSPRPLSVILDMGL